MRTINKKLNQEIKNKKFIKSLSKSIVEIIKNYKFIEETSSQFSPEAIELVAKFSFILSKKLLTSINNSNNITTETIYNNTEMYLKGELKHHALHQSRKVFITNKSIKSIKSSKSINMSSQPRLNINFKIFNYLLPKNKTISNIAATSLSYVLEYIITEILEISTNQANNIIFPEDIVSTITKDNELRFCIN